MADRLLIGCGTGRCGTVSLAALWARQDGLACTHERQRFPWEAALPAAVAWWEAQLAKYQAPIYADVAFYWLPYLEGLWQRWPEMRVVCLQRERTATIRSYLRKTDGFDPFRRTAATATCLAGEQWNACYPDYSACPTKEAAIGTYWDDYYRRATELQARHPTHFRLCSMESALSDPAGQQALLDFCGLPRSGQHLDLTIHLNAAR